MEVKGIQADFYRRQSGATFWTSEEYDNEKAYYRGFNIEHGDIHKDVYSKEFSYSVRCVRNNPPVLVIDSTDQVTDSSFTAYVDFAHAGGARIDEKGLCWSESPEPTNTDSHESAGEGIGKVIFFIDSLEQSKTYYVRAYVKTPHDVFYSEEIIVKTSVTLPMVTTSGISSIGSNTATGGGNAILKPGMVILSKGVCWSTSPNPTIAGNKTTNGTGGGTFTSSITGLSPNTLYYVKAYATVEGGVSYGNQVTFTTTPVNETGTFTDTRDGKSYNTIHIGNQWWMAENLAYKMDEGSWFYYDDSATYSQYGRLYNFEAAKNACPAGWHLPSDNDWKALETNIGMSADVINNVDWRGTNQATQLKVGGASGFNAKMGGQKYDYGSFADIDVVGTFWTSTQSTETKAFYRGFNTNHTDIHREAYAKLFGYSVRCLKNSPAEVVLDSVESIEEYGATVYITINIDGGTPITERGICWGTSPLPTVGGSHTVSGTGIGTFNIELTGLNHTTTYYARAYAINADGTTYSNQLMFTTLVALPVVTTTNVTSITSNSAASGGNVTAGPGLTVLSRGVCWNTTGNPTVSNSKTTNGTGTGTFTSALTSLQPNKTYYVRAYATVAGGVGYGNEISFTTQPLSQTGTVTDTRDGKRIRLFTLEINGGLHKT
ncbi:MAG: hypothetical protein HC905_15920 [Bacteroidales bacterium]|nr:hypothetical protein [Bacteroidales bacterium]